MTDVERIWLLAAGALGVAVILFVSYLLVSTARSRPKGGRHRTPSKNRPHRDTFRTEDPEPEPKKRAAVIVQGQGGGARDEIRALLALHDWDEPLWRETDDLESAAVAAQTALDWGVDVVCVRGSSAIRRGVVGVLAGTETPVAFLPINGNDAEPAEPSGDWSDLAATHTARAGEELATAMATALTGQNSRIDVGRATLAPAEASGAPEEPAEPVVREVVFLHTLTFGDIVAIDAPALSASAKEVVKGVFEGTSFTAIVKPDDEEAITRPVRSLSFSTSEAPPESAEGEQPRALDAYLHASQTFKGWAGVARAMMRKSSRATPLLVPLRSIAFTVTLDKPTEITVDGTSIGVSHPGESTVAVDPLALVVRR